MKKGEGGDRTSSNRTGQLLENRLGKGRRRLRRRERKEERKERKRNEIHKSKSKKILK